MSEPSRLYLGAPILHAYDDPKQWVHLVERDGYRAAYCPVGIDSSAEQRRAYADAAREAGIVISEVGAWCNPLSPDAATRAAAIERCQKSLALAEEMGALCCVNVAGSRGPDPKRWAGPHETDWDDDALDAIVASVREIVDAVNPVRSCYALETMPWTLPDSPDAYLELMCAIDRPGFGVHMDIANMIQSPRRYYRNGAFIRECFEKLGPHVRSCHAKDIRMDLKGFGCCDETQPGLGTLDYRVFFRELRALGRPVPVMLEHLPNETQYREAATYLRSVAGTVFDEV